MSESKYQLISFPSSQFNFINPRLNKYSFILIGENLSINSIEEELNSIDKTEEITSSNSFFKRNNILSIGILKSENLPAFKEEVSLLKQKVDLSSSHFMVLLDYENPNKYRSTEHRPAEESFLISPSKFIQFYKENIKSGLCYHLMISAINDKNNLEQILAHQISHPNPTFAKKTEQLESAEVIIPHRGNLEDLNDLENALYYLEKQHVSPQKVSVCFDEFVSEDHFKVADKQKNTKFYVNFPSGIGPYPSRDQLARASKEDIIVFHDSDDISTIDRISILTKELKNETLDAIGSHELRVNTINKKIEAIRFPEDVIGVKNKQEWHTIFFPTTAIKKSAYLKVGGLSTIRKHSSDSQFYWRAHFFLNIKNVDEFLYIRVKRENSLTTASPTALGTIVRERLRRQWRTDFLRIRNRNISLLESTLLDEYLGADINIISLEKEHREMILAWQELNIKMNKCSLAKNIPNPAFPKEEAVLEDRILDYKLVKEPGVAELKKSLSWRIGWATTRIIILFFGWIPYVKNRL